MGERLVKNKLVLIGLAAILLVSCGGSGGGGGSSNVPMNPGNNVSPIPQKPGIVNPSNPIPNNPSDSVKRESLEELRARMDETKVKEFIFNEQKNSTENIPTDSRVLNGSTQKVAILDSNFTRNGNDLQKRYPKMKIVKADGNNSPHGEEVLITLMENGVEFEPVVAGIGILGTEGGISLPKKELYEKVAKEMGNQKIKVFNQSFGVAREMDKYNSWGGVNDYRAALSQNNGLVGELIKQGEDLIGFYEKEVKDNSIFVWANGNTIKENGNIIYPTNAFLTAGLPKFRSELEKGWITAVGIQEENSDGIKNIHYKNHLAYPGNEAKWWAISANAETTYKKENGGHIEKITVYGSSYAAPRITKAVALVAEKYDWMTNDQVRQTLFTTTDRTEANKSGERNTLMEPDYFYGWGMLNQERALKGPGAFINIRRQYQYSPSSNNIFKADIPENKVSYFENDIFGDGGLEKLGKGTLHLTGNNSYERGSIVKEGTLEIYKIHANQINVEDNGKLVLHSKAIIGYSANPNDIIDEKEITSNNIIAKNVYNKGTVKVTGTTAIIGGDYIAHSGSKTEIDFSSKVRVLGKVDMQGGAITLSSNNYITAKGFTNTIMEGKSIEGSISNIETNGMRTANVEVKDGKVVATLSRKNAVDYIGDEALESSKNIAENVEKIFKNLDQKVKDGTASKEELTMGATVQTMSTSSFVSATEMMSGEIYASAQALTFSQAQNVNRDLSNRLAGLDNFKNSNKDSEVWFSAIGSGGKLRRDGYASADTRVTGGQFGMDTTFEGVTTLGVAMNYSYAKADFNRYAGESKSEMVGVSFYGKQDLPYGFYTAGRLGLSNISSKVERELLTSSGDTVTGKIKHHDKMLSAYIEIGKKFGWFTPFVGYSQDYLRRGSFNESEASWGVKADSKNYRASNFLIGARAEYVGDKYRLQAYVTQAINTDKRDLSYEGSFTGSSVKQKFYGVKQAKNTTWIGFGAFREITPVFGLYGNVDFRVEDKKWADSVISTGLQYRF